MKTIFDMIEHFSTLFNTEMTEDLRQIARGQGSQAISLRHKLD